VRQRDSLDFLTSAKPGWKADAPQTDSDNRYP